MGEEPVFAIRDSLSASHVDELLSLYSSEWWTKARTRADVERMLAATDLVFAVVECSSDVLVAFARVLTDRIYLALVLDVIVASAFRGQGLGRLLLGRICSDPALADVASIELVCQPELMPFYREYGFFENVGRSRLMRRSTDPRLRDRAGPQASAADIDASHK